MNFFPYLLNGVPYAGLLFLGTITFDAGTGVSITGNGAGGLTITAAGTSNISGTWSFSGSVYSGRFFSNSGGTAAAPFISDGGSGNTGIFFTTGTTFGIATAGLVALSISAAQVSTFSGIIKVPGVANALITTTAAITSGGAAAAGTLLNAPTAGNPTKWARVDDNGTIRFVPLW